MKTKQPSTTLSKRQNQVLQGLSQGETNKETAQRIGISSRTVETYRERTMRAMGAKNSTEALHRATELGLLKSPRKLDK